MNKDYTIHINITRKNSKITEAMESLSTTEFEDDQDLCEAVASQTLEMLGELRERDDE